MQDARSLYVYSGAGPPQATRKCDLRAAQSRPHPPQTNPRARRARREVLRRRAVTKRF